MPGPGAYWIGDEELEEVTEVLRAGHVYRYGDLEDPSFRRKVLTFEKEFAEYVGVPYCVATSSGTSTLLISLKAIGIEPGDEIIIPTYTFIASYGAPIFLGAVPVLAEIDESLCIDPKDIEKRITPRTKAIMPVHILGNPCEMDAISAIAEKHGLAVIEDCCQACGASFRGRKVGSFGALGGFSLNVFKTITAGDGGMLVSRDRSHYDFAFSMQDQGYKKKDGVLRIEPPSILGLNFRMNEVTGAVALAQLRKLDRILATLRSKKKRLKEAIRGLPGVAFRKLNDEEGECATLLTVLFESREAAARVARELGTVTVDETGWHVFSNMDQVCRHLASVGQKCTVEDFPRSQDLLNRSINLSVGVVDAGLGSAFGIDINSSDEEIDQVAERFRRACRDLL